MDEKRSAGKAGSSLVYGTAMNNLEASLMAILGVPDVPVDEITADLIRAHERRLSAPEPSGLGHKVNYVNRQLRTLRTVLRRAEADGGADIRGRVEAAVARALARERGRKGP